MTKRKEALIPPHQLPNGPPSTVSDHESGPGHDARGGHNARGDGEITSKAPPGRSGRKKAGLKPSFGVALWRYRSIITIITIRNQHGLNGLGHGTARKDPTKGSEVLRETRPVVDMRSNVSVRIVESVNFIEKGLIVLRI